MVLTTILDGSTITAGLHNIKIEDTPVALIAAVYKKSDGMLVYFEMDDTRVSVRNETAVKVFDVNASLYPQTDYIIKVFAWEKNTYIPLTPASMVK